MKSHFELHKRLHQIITYFRRDCGVAAESARREAVMKALCGWIADLE